MRGMEPNPYESPEYPSGDAETPMRILGLRVTEWTVILGLGVIYYLFLSFELIWALEVEFAAYAPRILPLSPATHAGIGCLVVIGFIAVLGRVIWTTPRQRKANHR
jgi:hypothetical protein